MSEQQHWSRINTAPEHVLIRTCTMSTDGKVFNLRHLEQRNGVWFTATGLRVYYRPTHWRL